MKEQVMAVHNINIDNFNVSVRAWDENINSIKWESLSAKSIIPHPSLPEHFWCKPDYLIKIQIKGIVFIYSSPFICIIIVYIYIYIFTYSSPFICNIFNYKNNSNSRYRSI